MGSRAAGAARAGRARAGRCRRCCRPVPQEKVARSLARSGGFPGPRSAPHAVPSTRGHVEVGGSPVGRRQTADGGRGALALLELSPETSPFPLGPSVKALPRRGGTEKERDAPVSPLGLPPPPLPALMLGELQLPARPAPPRRGPAPRAAAGHDGSGRAAMAGPGRSRGACRELQSSNASLLCPARGMPGAVVHCSACRELQSSAVHAGTSLPLAPPGTGGDFFRLFFFL